MKRKITKDSLIERIKEIDTRTKGWSDAKIDKIITNAFVELTTVAQPFSNSVYEDLNPYYETGEEKGSIVLPYSVLSVYDMYLVKENQDEDLYTRGELKNRNENVIWQNPQDKDTIYFNLESKYAYDLEYDAIVAKYFYIPLDADFTELYLFSDEAVALETAMEVAVFEAVKDEKTAISMRKKLSILGGNLIEPEPTDFPSPDRRSIFAGYYDV